MPSAREINRRIKSVTNTQQITKAMKMVSSVRLRRAQDRALATAPYTEKIEGMLQRVCAASSGSNNLLLAAKSDSQKVCYIVVGADKGLAGAFNANINKAMAAAVKDLPRTSFVLFTVGRKPAEYLQHLHLTADRKWSGFSDKPQFTDAQAIAQEAAHAFVTGEVSAVKIIYTNFKSALAQEVTQVDLLPIAKPAEEHTRSQEAYLFAPEPEAVLHALLPQYLDMVVYNSLLQSAAGELGARMTAMTSATDNAGELIEKLTVHYNKVRQAGITNELTEIVSGANALQ